MTTFLTASQVPQTKLRLKKAILNGTIVVFENNSDYDNGYGKVTDISSLLELWHGFHYRPTNQNQNNEAWACLGTSFYYKFAKA